MWFPSLNALNQFTDFVPHFLRGQSWCGDLSDLFVQTTCCTRGRKKTKNKNRFALKVSSNYEVKIPNTLTVVCLASACFLGWPSTGFALVTCRMTWFFRCIFWLNVAEQTWHSNFFFPTCFSICLNWKDWKVLGPRKMMKYVSHLAIFFVVITFPHMEHSELILDFGRLLAKVWRVRFGG